MSLPRIQVIHGPNLNLLGRRETGIYGRESLDSINARLTRMAAELGVEIAFVQRNGEGGVVDAIHRAWDGGAAGILINPGALSHYSLAVRDALAAVAASPVPIVEVHLSNVHAREDFRRVMVTSSVVTGQVTGFGPLSYELGLRALVALLDEGT